MTEKTTLIVNDMTCGHCVGTLRNALAEVLPDTEIEVDLATHRVTFAGDRAKAEEAIREAGYTPEPA